MNNPAMTQRAFFEAGVNQIIKDIETMLQLYTEAVIVLLIAGLCVFLWLLISELKQSKGTPVRSNYRPVNQRSPKMLHLAGASFSESSHERLSLEQSSFC